MTQSRNLARDIANAELAGDVHLLAAIARDLLCTPDQRSVKARTQRARIEDEHLLTLTERRARGLPPLKTRLIKDGVYQWASVSFANAHRILVGFYPRAGEAPNLTAARAARTRYLLTLSGGRLIDVAKARELAAIEAVRVLSDAGEIERERLACIALRLAIERELASQARLRIMRERAEQRSALGRKIELARIEEGRVSA